jgi:hypothetical protein
VAPTKRRTAARVTDPGARRPPAAAALMAEKPDEPTFVTRKRTPMMKAASPTRLTTKAFMPALEAEGRSNQKPMRR